MRLTLGFVCSAIALASLGTACTSASSSSGGPGSSGSSGSSGASGSSGGSSGSSGSSAGGGGAALPATTFLYESKVDKDHEVLIAYDTTGGAPRTVTDLTGDGSNGWTIDGFSLSPDRTRIAVASLYGPTQADIDTKFAAQHIWTFAIDGSDFRRLTPPHQADTQGRSQFRAEIRNPAWSQSGSDIIYGLGEYWYEGTTLRGGTDIWSVAAAGGSLPVYHQSPVSCSRVDPSADPKTGKIAVLHSVCTGSKDGIYLYAPDGSGTPETLVTADSGVSPVLESPRWLADGSGFLFVGVQQITVNGASATSRGLFAFDMTTRKATPIVLPEAANTFVVDGTFAPDGSAIVYCLQVGDAQDLHAIDLTKTPATEAALTTDGKSCHPVW